MSLSTKKVFGRIQEAEAVFRIAGSGNAVRGATLAHVGICGRPMHLAGTVERLARTVSIGNDDLGGVVTSAAGVEGGVWMIAETTDLPTKMAKIMVTDDRGGATSSPISRKPTPPFGFLDTGCDQPTVLRREG